MEDLLKNFNSIEGVQDLFYEIHDHNAITKLCNVIGIDRSSSSLIRQHGAILLRMKFLDVLTRKTLKAPIRDRIKKSILQAFVHEPEKFVKIAIAHLITVIVEHEFKTNSWPEALLFIQTLNNNESIADKEMGMYLLNILTENTSEHFAQHSDYIASLFITTLESVSCPSPALQHYTLLTMMHFIPLVDKDQNMANCFHKLMPRVIDIIKAMSAVDESRACEEMELFDELLEISIPTVDYIEPLMSLCLELAATTTLGDELRVKAVHIIGLVVQVQKKFILENGFLEPILHIVFDLMRLPTALTRSAFDTYYQEFVLEDIGAGNVATQTLDLLVCHLPPEEVVTNMLPYMEHGLQGTDPFAKKSTFLAMGLIAEGCTEFISTNYLKIFVQWICQGMEESNPVVRNSALFALGQLTKHLQPDVSPYYSQVLPVMFDYLSYLTLELRLDPNASIQGAESVFYAFELFCKNLKDKLLPYLPELFDRLIAALNPGLPLYIRELAINAIGNIAVIGSKNLIPYFPRIIESLNCFWTMKENDDTVDLKIRAIHTFSQYWLAVGHETFQPLVQGTLELAIRVMQESVEPRIRKATYSLIKIAAVGAPAELAPHLSLLVPTLLSAGWNTKGVDVYNSASGLPYIEEKLESFDALQQISVHVGRAFHPWLKRSFVEVWNFLRFLPQTYDPHKTVISSLTKFCINFNEIASEKGRKELGEALQRLVPRLALFVNINEDVRIVSAALNSYTELLKVVQHPVIAAPESKKALISCVKAIYLNKTSCQAMLAKYSLHEDDLKAQLLRSAGRVILGLGSFMAPEEFVELFTTLLPTIIKMTKSSHRSKRLIGAGITVRSLKYINTSVDTVVPKLYPQFINWAKDDDAEMRHNAIFGLGEMAFYSERLLLVKYTEIFHILFKAAGSDTSTNGILDNVCGTLARLILRNVEAIPMDQIFPVLTILLPLKEDFIENKVVFKCMEYLYRIKHPEFMKHMQPIIRAALHVFHEEQGSQDDLEMISSFLRSCLNDFPESFTEAFSDIPAEQVATLQALTE